MATGADCVGRELSGIIRGTNFTISGIDGQAMGLVASFNLGFERKITRIYDLASPRFYYVEGASEGQVQFDNVVGPLGAPKLACECVAKDIILNAGPTICPVGAQPLQAQASQFSYTLKNALPFGLSGQGEANNFLIIFSIKYMFNNIE